MSDELYERLIAITRSDRRFHPRSYEFIFEALEYTIRHRDTGGHVSGHELLDGIREFALQEFGFLSRAVFEMWGIHCTEDFGHIVFNLVDHNLMRKTDQDSLEDFRDGFDFLEAFDAEFQPDLSTVTLDPPTLSPQGPLYD